MANTPKPTRRKLKTVNMLNRYGKKLGYTMHPPVWVDGVPHVAFSKPRKECREVDETN